MKTDAPSPAASLKRIETVGTDCDTNYTTPLRELPTTPLAGNLNRIAPLAAFKEEIATQITTASQVNHEKIQEIKTVLAAENESLKKEISSLKERIITLELTHELSSLGENASQSTLNPSSGLANMLDEQIRKTTRETLDKLATKNNIIIKASTVS
ncbi:hypothetical protein KQX54_013657 [Cotesia glomerata]|uniref:Uncharacterized protein n=1 Tax=Cotesia glomerata TaxID=32391 RepID=A0AAV7I0T3_COTGL|nr:hypothetical protein KQX54_013657 [Cotesia glomerata]